MKFFIDTSGRWSGGGQAFLNNAALATQRHKSLVGSPDGAIPLIARNVPASRRGLPRPYLIAPQNAWPWQPRVRGWEEAKLVGQLRLASEFYLRRSAGVMRISSAIPAVSGRPASPAIHNVLDTDFERAVAASEVVAHGFVDLARDRIVSVGSGHSYRNLPFLIESYRRYREAGGTRGLLIGGPAGNERVKRDVEAARLGVPDLAVVWASLPREVCLAAFREAALVVLPSMIEASPFSVLEAIAMNPRVALSSIVGNHEILDQSVPDSPPLGAAAFDPANPDDAARAFGLVMSDPVLVLAHSALADVAVRDAARESWGERLVDWLESLGSEIELPGRSPRRAQ